MLLSLLARWGPVIAADQARGSASLCQAACEAASWLCVTCSRSRATLGGERGGAVLAALLAALLAVSDCSPVPVLAVLHCCAAISNISIEKGSGEYFTGKPSNTNVVQLPLTLPPLLPPFLAADALDPLLDVLALRPGEEETVLHCCSALARLVLCEKNNLCLVARGSRAYEAIARSLSEHMFHPLIVQNCLVVVTRLVAGSASASASASQLSPQPPPPGSPRCRLSSPRLSSATGDHSKRYIAAHPEPVTT